MKNLSLKQKLTILYTILMTINICTVFAVLFSLSNREILSSVQNRLRESVAGSFDDIEWEDGRLNFDTDLLELENGVYLSVYDEEGVLLYGKIPYGFDQSMAFQDGLVRRQKAERVEYYVFDMSYAPKEDRNLMVRGIISITDAEESFRITLRLALVFLPLLVVLTAVLGYFMTRRTLRPVSHITETVRSIQEEEDLSRRIDLGEGRDEIYRLASTFDNMLEQIEGSMKREKQFTSDVSHELRTPLAVILMQCDSLLSQDGLTDEAREEITVIRKKAEGLSRMIAQLLLLSRADQGREKVTKETLDFSELSEMAAAEMTALAEVKEIRLETEITPHLMVCGDETLLIRLWLNLLQNAVTYGKKGGCIRMSLQDKDEMVAGCVEDDGIGISAEDLPHIWERFYRADSARSDSGSSGLGLSMVQWIVSVHNGTIQAASQPGRGSRFTFQIPKEKKS
ncbi:ATP-binding protein [Blautia pseudococcoides]|uniref:sensor histidine kinase n=1 Tax=Blautia pseudococcoides TaxID=1796616 RepID=UPI00148B0C1C|nr:ATP-binding protein [Blautia pseudococcoides]QJU16959.1 HAMP domain-containing protein [Blautia pseudococcoides]